jgi:hypothetical protein
MIKMHAVFACVIGAVAIAQPIPVMAKGKSAKANVSDMTIKKQSDSSSHTLMMRKTGGSGSHPKEKSGWDVKANKKM